jgi:thiosulfate reductase cytochrome b subunit
MPDTRPARVKREQKPFQQLNPIQKVSYVFGVAIGVALILGAIRLAWWWLLWPLWNDIASLF